MGKLPGNSSLLHSLSHLNFRVLTPPFELAFWSSLTQS